MVVLPNTHMDFLHSITSVGANIAVIEINEHPRQISLLTHSMQEMTFKGMMIWTEMLVNGLFNDH